MQHQTSARSRCRPFALAACVAALVGACGGGESGGESKAVPDVVGLRLDVAKDDLKNAGVDDDHITVLGGGSLGIVTESNWIVCDQEPRAGAPKADRVRLTVDRVCGDDDSLDPSGSTTTKPAVQGTTATSGVPATSSVRTVPNMVGQDLQDAQDAMQAAGFYNLKSHDLSGEDRSQVLDRNWKVCNQTPRGGTQASTDTLIDFGVVKDEESCP